MDSDGGSIRMQLEALFSDSDALLAGEDLRQRAILSSFIRLAPEAIAIGDLEGRQICANRICHELFGYDYELQEMNGLALSDLWPAEEVLLLNTLVLPGARSGGWHGEVRQKRKDGTLFEASLSVFPVADRNEHPVYVAAIIRDISAFRAAERAKEQASHALRARKAEAVVEIAQEIATAPTSGELYRRAVTLIKERLGYDHVHIFYCAPEQQEVRLLESTSYAVAQTLPYGKGIIGTVAAEGRAISVPDLQASRVIRPETSESGGEIAVPIKWRGQVVGVLDVRTDQATAISKEDEPLLLTLAGQIAVAAESIRLLEEANIIRQFGQASEGIGWITLEGHLIIYVNPTLAGILQETRPEDAFGKPVTAYYPEWLRRRLEEEVFPTVMKEGRWSGELELLSARGESVPTIQSLFLIRDQDGRPLYIANVVTDISEQKRAERILTRRARQTACLNEIGQRSEQNPPLTEFLSWVAGRIPQAMEHPHACKALIEFNNDMYGTLEALTLPVRVIEPLNAGDEQVGRLCVSYAQNHNFLDDERTLISDIARRINIFIESQRLLEQSRILLEELKTVHNKYIHKPWVEPAAVGETLPVIPSEDTRSPVLISDSHAITLSDALPHVPAGQSPTTTPEPATREEGTHKGLREIWRRVITGLFILSTLTLGGLLLSWAISHRVKASSTHAVVTVAPFPREQALALEATFSASTPVVIPASPTTSPTAFALPSPTSSPPSPTPAVVTEPAGPTLVPVAFVVPDPFPVPGPNQRIPSTTLVIPTPVQPVPVAADAINIAVLGSDQRPDWSEWHTDVVQIVSVQRDHGTVSVLSIPRDLYVYIPGFWMSRINFAHYYGEAYDYAGGGPQLLRDALLYNLGIRVDYYARTDFDGLIGIVDTLGGIDVPVHCRLSDHWPYPDEHGEYPILTLEPGVHHMDGETALWYARSRLTTSVFSREKRQQQVLQAIWRKARDTGLLSRVPALWKQGREMVETDLPFSLILDLARIALTLDEKNVRFYNIDADEVTPWVTPYGGRVYLPRWEAIEPVIAEAMAPPPETRLSRTYIPVEVWNGTPEPGWDVLAVDRLYRAGFPAVIGESDRHDYASTQMLIFGNPAKGDGADYLQKLFDLSDDQVIRLPGEKSTYPIRLIIGADYKTCPEEQ